jgi:hypothetical protein
MSTELPKMPEPLKYTGKWHISYDNGFETVYSAFELMQRLAFIIPRFANIHISRL